MKIVLVLLSLLLISCQEKKTDAQAQTQVQASSAAKVEDKLFEEKDPGCEDSEMTEDKIVAQAMEAPKTTEGGALQGATDCEIE